jgi:hypothetical protein
MGTLAFSKAGVLENKSSSVVMHANAPMKDHSEIRHCGSPVGREPEPKKNRPATDLAISIMIRFNKQTKKKILKDLKYGKKIISQFCAIMYLQKHSFSQWAGRL